MGDDDEDDDAEQNATQVNRFDADGKKIGAKKAKKLEEKENRRVQREMMEREREEEKQRKEERDQLRLIFMTSQVQIRKSKFLRKFQTSQQKLKWLKFGKKLILIKFSFFKLTCIYD